MKKFLFALLAILYLVIAIGCPPSTPNEDAFGPGPDRPTIVDDDDPVDTPEGDMPEGDMPEEGMDDDGMGEGGEDPGDDPAGDEPAPDEGGE